MISRYIICNFKFIFNHFLIVFVIVIYRAEIDKKLFLSKKYRGRLNFKENVSLLCFEGPLAVECGNLTNYHRTQVLPIFSAIVTVTVKFAHFRAVLFHHKLLSFLKKKNLGFYSFLFKASVKEMKSPQTR